MNIVITVLKYLMFIMIVLQIATAAESSSNSTERPSTVAHQANIFGSESGCTEGKVMNPRGNCVTIHNKNMKKKN